MLLLLLLLVVEPGGGPQAAWPPRGRITKLLECQRLAKHPFYEARAISEHTLVNKFILNGFALHVHTDYLTELDIINP